MVSVVSVVSFRSFRFVVSGFSTCPHSGPHNCPLTISNCPLSVLWRCPSYREFGDSKMTEIWPGPAPGVRLTEVFVKRELTVQNIQSIIISNCFEN